MCVKNIICGKEKKGNASRGIKRRAEFRIYGRNEYSTTLVAPTPEIGQLAHKKNRLRKIIVKYKCAH